MQAGRGTTFFGIGISYQQADLKTREKFSFSIPQQEQLLTSARNLPVEGVLLISTCNRTELYGWSPNVQLLERLLLDHCEGSEREWQEISWRKEGKEGMNHLFRVGAGLESSILGDFQIIGQIRKAYQLSKEMGLGHSYLERLLNTTIRISKRVKSETQISRGSASLAFAASSYIRSWIEGEDTKQANILLVGVGDIGKATCSNLLKHIALHQLTLINRSEAKAKELAAKYQVEAKTWETLPIALHEADVVIVATGASQPVIKIDMVPDSKQQLFLDLSMPRNIDPDIAFLPQSSLLDLDELIEQTREAVEQRTQEVPMAEEILNSEAKGFFHWMESRKFAPLIKELKQELVELHQHELAEYKRKHPEIDDHQMAAMSQLLIHKTTGHLAKFFRNQLHSLESTT